MVDGLRGLVVMWWKGMEQAPATKKYTRGIRLSEARLGSRVGISVFWGKHNHDYKDY